MDLLTWVSDAECCHPEVLSTGCTQLNVTAIVVMDTCFGQHGVVLYLALPAGQCTGFICNVIL